MLQLKTVITDTACKMTLQEMLSITAKTTKLKLHQDYLIFKEINSSNVIALLIP